MLHRFPCSTLIVPHDATGLGSQFTHSATRVPCCVLSLGTYNFNDENPQLWGSRMRNNAPYLSLQSVPENGMVSYLGSCHKASPWMHLPAGTSTLGTADLRPLC